jgi:ABC-type polysaccharide/polyol phosphate export permease
VAASAGLIWLFPVTFISNIFVPGDRLPSVLKPVAAWNPLSTVTSACRDLFGNPNPFIDDSFPARHPIALSLVYCVLITAIFAPLAIRKYSRATSV